MSVAKQMKVFACGGTGINICKKITNPIIDVVIIDSSDSNTGGIMDDNIYTIDGMDGAGKIRSKTYEAFAPLVDQTLTTHKPSEVSNLIVCSLTGGTGGMVANMMVKRMLEKNLPVVVLVEHRINEAQEAKNALGALKTFAHIAKTLNKPITIYFAEQEKQSAVDAEIVRCVDVLSLVIDKSKTLGSDRSDFFNFINYNEPRPDVPCQVSALNVVLNEEDNDVNEKGKRNKIIVTSILLTKDIDSGFKGVKPLYSSRTIVTDEAFPENTEYRLDNVVGEVTDYIDYYETFIKEAEDLVASTKIKEIDLTGANDDGMFF